MKLKPPDLWPPVGLSEKEHEATKYLYATVHALVYFVEGFAAALELYRFSKSRPANVAAQTALKWKWFALDAGAMEIWHLREALEVLPRRIGPCATVARFLDRDAMRRAVNLFDEKHFANFELLRHGIAHAPIVSGTRNGYVLDDGSIAASRITDEDRYEVVNKGKRYHFDMTDETLRKVTEVVTVYWSAFAPVVKEFDQAGRSDG